MKLKRKIKIGKKWIGEGSPCFIIAELGSNHNRKLSQAKKLIEEAATAGADAVKFQVYQAEALYPKGLEARPGKKEKPFNKAKKTEIPREWLKELCWYCQRHSLIFLASPFDKEAVDCLEPLVPAFKWASLELIERPLLEYTAKKGKPLIISTGFYGLKQVAEAVKWVKQGGNNKIILLHCTGLYPALLEEANLAVIPVLKKRFQCPVGFSDHTLDTVIPASAVALNADVIEKHFTLSRNLKGPDHSFALNPGELKEMIDNIRSVEKALGSSIKKPVEREITKERFVRRGIVAQRDLKKGEKITGDDIMTKRVGEGAILPKDFYRVLGKRLAGNVKKDQKITWKMI